ncbi:MAG: tape measure protein, partial [Casimicrobium sp.]
MTDQVTTIGVGVDSRSVKEAATNFDAMTAAGGRSSKLIEQLVSQFAKANNSLSTLVDQTAKKNKADNDGKTAIESYISALERQASVAGKTASQLRLIEAASKGATEAQLAQVRALGLQIDSAKSADGAVGSLASRFAGFAAASVSIGAVGSAFSFVRKEITDAQIASDKFNASLLFSTGSASAAARELGYVKEVSRALGLQTNATADSYVKLSAATKGTALEGAQTRATFEAIAKASTVMGLSAEQTNGAFLALQQIVSKGTVQAEELRGQLGERIPGAFQIAARAMGVTTQELGKLLEQGKVVSTEFVPKFAAQLEKELGGSAEKAAQSMQAFVNRQESANQALKEAAANTGLGDF